MFEVLIIDDMGKAYSKDVNLYLSDVICDYVADEEALFFLDKPNYFRGYDLVLLDATYYCSRNQKYVVEIVQELVKKDPDILNKVVVLFGKGIQEFLMNSSQYEDKIHLSQIRGFSRVVYDEEKENKIEVMNNIIKSKAIKKGIKIEKVENLEKVLVENVREDLSILKDLFSKTVKDLRLLNQKAEYFYVDLAKGLCLDEILEFFEGKEEKIQEYLKELNTKIEEEKNKKSNNLKR